MERRYNFLREWFPYQFRSIPSIIVWTLVFIVDVVLVFVAAHLIGFNIFTAELEYRLRTLILMGYLLIAFGLFCLESFIYNKLH